MNAKMLTELEEAARWFNGQISVQVVIVAGAGRTFCAGVDLRDPFFAMDGSESGKSWIERCAVGQTGSRMVEAIERMRATTIARIQGRAVGGGVLLTAACDLRVAAETTIFSIPEMDLGLPLTWGGIPRLVREVGPARTKEWVMTCRPFTAEEAKEAGFLNRVVPEAELDQSVEELAATLAAKAAAPLAITKAHVNAAANAMGTGSTAYADSDILAGTAMDPESRAAALAYVERQLMQKPEAK